MEIDSPVWNSEEHTYTFQFTGTVPTVEDVEGITDLSGLNIKQVASLEIVDNLLIVFLEKTKRYFVTPMQKETVKKHLRHYISSLAPFPEVGQSYKAVWKPTSMKLKSNEFCLYWSVCEWKPSPLQIRPDFFRSKSPGGQSPELQPNLRTIHIQNTMDTLVPVGDLPLSDLPPLNFGEETPEKKEVRRRIREARLKVELAKLKAKRMEQKYYERYGEAGPETEESSLGSSDSDSDGHFGRYL